MSHIEMFNSAGKLKNLRREKGVSIYLALMIMTILLAIVFGLSAISLGQIKTIRGMGNSVAAFYAAETGIERALYTSGCDSTCSLFGDLDLGNGNISHYDVSGIAPGADCSGSNYCLVSIGSFNQTRRAIQISR
jgi:hypothetical protein